MQQMQCKANPEPRIGAKLRWCLAGAQRLCGDSPPPASFRHTKQTRLLLDVCHLRLSEHWPTKSFTVTPRHRCNPLLFAAASLAQQHSLRCSGEQGRNVQKSAFPVGEMRTTINPGQVRRDETSGLWFWSKSCMNQQQFIEYTPTKRSSWVKCMGILKALLRHTDALFFFFVHHILISEFGPNKNFSS